MSKKMQSPKEKTSLKYFFKLLYPYKKDFLLSLIAVIIAAVGVVSGPKIFGEATTILVQGFSIGAHNKIVINVDFAKLYDKLLLLTIIYVIVAIADYIRNYIMSKVAVKAAYDIRKSIDTKLNNIPIKHLDSLKDGDIISTVVNDTNTIFDALTQSLAQSIYSIFVVVGILYMMFQISWEMTIIALLSIPLILIVGMIIMKLSQKYFIIQQEGIAQLNVHVEEMYSNHVIVQAYNGKEIAINKFNELNDNLVKSARRSQFLTGLIFPITAFINNIAYVIVIIIGAHKVINNAINIGELQSFFQYMQQFSGPLQQLSQLSFQLQSSAAASKRIITFLDSPELEEPEDEVVLNNVEGRVQFEHVNFSYVPDVPVIKDFSLDVEPGQKVAIVGSTGAGKTTLINLLMRFYEVNSGIIKLDGIDMRKLSRSTISEVFSMVLQDTWLFNGTIGENIAYGNKFTSKEEIEMAARFANADHFIKTLPQRYDTIINEEASNISQGQKQLLTIARAFLGNKRILILDEATSSVDTRTEKLIQNAMEKLMYGKTSFIIAHRLSTIQNADIILVMEHGNIVEKGNHEELLAQNGVYAKLYYSQFETIAE